MTHMTNRQDPIRDKYYRPLELAEIVSTWIFYVGAILSFATLSVDSKVHPDLYHGILTSFVLVIVVYFAIGVLSRYYLFPRAEDARRKEFLSSVYGVELIHQRTVGYYNNNEKDVNKKLLLTVLENSFFSKSILRSMLIRERVRLLCYVVFLSGAVVWRSTPLDWIVAGTQMLFSEEILTRWIRLEWLRIRAESIFDKTRLLVQSKPSAKVMQPMALQAFGEYECGKALGGILLSEKIFEKNNKSLTEDWQRVKQGLNL